MHYHRAKCDYNNYNNYYPVREFAGLYVHAHNIMRKIAVLIIFCAYVRVVKWADSWVPVQKEAGSEYQRSIVKENHVQEDSNPSCVPGSADSSCPAENPAIL